MDETIKFKKAVVAEYLRGTFSYRALGIKYNIPPRSICDWVLAHRGKDPSLRRRMYRKLEKEIQGKVKKPKPPEEINALQQELSKQKLYSMMLEEIIMLGSRHTGFDWKKKFGTKQS